MTWRIERAREPELDPYRRARVVCSFRGCGRGEDEAEGRGAEELKDDAEEPLVLSDTEQ